MKMLLALCLAGLTTVLSVSGCKKDMPPEPQPLQPVGKDTTSHEMTWETMYVGDGYNSILRGVVIIHDSLAYAIGEFYLKDSSGQLDYDHGYNLAIWNGHQWTPKTITYRSSPAPQLLYAICALDEHNVWFAGNGLFHWDGTSSTDIPGIQAIWGPVDMFALWVASPTDICVGGDSNYTAQLRASQWSRLSSGSVDRINDMWGTGSGSSSDVYFVSLNAWEPPYASRVGRITPAGKIDSIAFPRIALFYSIWTPDGSTLYVCGGGLFKFHASEWTEINIGTNNALTCIRGSGPNDIFTVGVFGTIAHYNGSTWRLYTLPSDVHFRSVAVKGDLVIAVGWRGSRGIAYIARRVSRPSDYSDR